MFKFLVIAVIVFVAVMFLAPLAVQAGKRLAREFKRIW